MQNLKTLPEYYGALDRGELAVHRGLTLTRDDVMNYYKSRYVPNNITFVVVGNVDAAKIRAELGEIFKTSPRRALEPVFVASEPLQLGRREAHDRQDASDRNRAAADRSRDRAGRPTGRSAGRGAGTRRSRRGRARGTAARRTRG
jgi:hypothetical protein